ncbi:MAG: HEAT repeat domain-containing protein [Smithella sp.]|jgi:HEAT repeat protein
MANVDLQLNAIDALVHIHSAIKNDQQYLSANPAIINFIETLYLYLVDTLRQDAPLVFAELEKNILSGENISDKKDDKTIHVSFLQDIFSGSGFKSFSFDEDPEKEELHIIINLLKQKRKPAQDEAYLPGPAAEIKTEQIFPDDKVYLTLERGEEVVTGPDSTEKIIPDNKVDLTLEKEHEVVTGPDSTEKIIPDDKVYLTLEGGEEVVTGPDNAEDKIPEGVASMEKVITRINVLDGAIESIPSEEKMDMLRKLSTQSAEWIERENAATPEFKELCRRLEVLVQEFISNGFFAEATPIINVFSKIYNGTLKKDDDIKEISLKVLRNLASTTNFNILFKEINTNEHDKKNEASQIFAEFGSLVIDKLLDSLKKDSDSKTRISIIHIIEEMGQAAIPAIKASINMNTPWYYLRNMAYVLGRIGNESSVDVLKPLLLHKEKRVCKEAFKSIVQTGGNMRGPMLLSMLFLVDQELRVDIIEALGKVKCKEAVTDLHNILKSNSTMAKNDISVPQKICNALGAIGSPEAIKVLTAIAESKSILGIGSYPKEVKYAAERTLAYIKRKQEE